MLTVKKLKKIFNLTVTVNKLQNLPKCHIRFATQGFLDFF